MKELVDYCYMRMLQLNLSGNLLDPNFKFSKGCFAKFKSRYKPQMRTGRVQLDDVDMEFNRPAFEANAEQLSAFAASGIYSRDETVIYLNVMLT